MIHWADQIAERVIATGRAPVISTGISPSGEIHIGNMREVLTADAIFRAIGERGVEPHFNYVCDNVDPLRKVYPFLDASTYEPLVGRPLSQIPCPCGGHASYGDHFLEPFLDALERLHVEVELERADELYTSGRMTPYVVLALEKRDRIVEILHELTGKQVAADWSPFSPRCTGCGRITAAVVTGFSAADETVDFRCECGGEGQVAIAGGGKLIWRIDWPARWMALGVTVEPFGKDHATRGGSYDTGVRIVREVFDGEPPFPIPYEWIRLKGGGDMSSSRGNVLSIHGMLEVVPPDVLRYLVIRERPQKTIAFDPALPLLQLADELESPDAKGHDPRSAELSRAAGFAPLGAPYKHLVVVAQVARFDIERVMRILARTGYAEVERPAVEDRLEYLRSWLSRFAPASLKFEVADALPDEARALDEAQRDFLRRLAEGLQDGMSSEQIHALIHELKRRSSATPPAELFGAIYLALLGKPRGPRAATFIEMLGPSFCAGRFRQAAGGS